MQNIAKKIGYSETAFVMKSDKADFRVRFFTPVDEVDLCGHATIATYNLLRDLDYNRRNFVIEQGDCMKTPSRIYVELKNHVIEIEEVYVGGKAVIVD